MELIDSETRYAIVDLHLGESSGLALLPSVRAANPSMRILILTGYASIETAADALRLGADSLLAKPAELSKIVDVLTGDNNFPAFMT